MVVIGIVFGIVGIMLLFLFIDWFNKASYKHFEYEFFTWEKFLLIAFANVLIFFGDSWYATALTQDGDTLNGILLTVIGVLIYIVWLYKNVDNTNYGWGLIGSIISALAFLPGTVIGFIAVLMVFAWASDTKPVVNLN